MSDAVTRTYPVQVAHDGKTYKVGEQVTLPAEKAAKLEARYGLEPVSSTAESKSSSSLSEKLKKDTDK